MDLKKDILPANKFYFLIQAMMIALIIIMGWFTLVEYMTFNDYLHNEQNEESHEFYNLIFKSAIVKQGTQDEMIRFVTVKELLYPAPEEYQRQILSSNFGMTKMTGLESHPSFIIRNGHAPFWQSQFILLLVLKFGGYIGLLIFVFFFARLNFKQNLKVFTKERKVLISGLSLGVFAYYFLEMILYGRMILFLNKEFYLGEHIIGGISEELLWLGLALVVAVSFIEKAIPLQEEQDLTI